MSVRNKQGLLLLLKVAIAIVAIGGVLLVAGGDLAPTLPASTWLLWSLGVAAGIAVLGALGLVVSLSVRQFILRKGGTDVQWLWFNTEPKGLVAQRARSRDD